MKKGLIVAMAIVLVAMLSGSAFAANSLSQGSKGISVGMGDSVFSHTIIVDRPGGEIIQNPVVDISGRIMLSGGMALYGGFGLQLNSGDVDGTYLGFTVGVRKYLSTNDFAPFVGGQVTYAQADADDAAGAAIFDMSVFDLAATFGAEYFLSKNFSLEGAIGIGLGKWEDNVGNTDGTYLGTRTVGVHANFYF